ncbi:hypothetical protein O1611_g4036 [Lasiodiplodia mahajangana]|uniref:Uncharacterized protein n=1 Tax=Lasiodiplodia mahajangana TaxID=1108764 RepID=A0ACC2JQ82_9PEZI|nr:hypothetical protein O1611_g4036 [Lasiodiplodia mahajangana]
MITICLVYNCKSDTISPASFNDMVLSVTHFPKKSTIFSVAYGCTEDNRDYIVTWLRYAKTFAFNPLLLPMLWAELERQRLIDEVDHKAADLRNRIIDMNNQVLDDALPKNSASSSATKDNNDMIEMIGGIKQKHITQRECEAVNLWVDVGTLKNGLESFRTELKSMLQHSRNPPENVKNALEQQPAPDEILRHSSDRIQSRLNEMIVELKGKVRHTDSLLGGMTLATQTESNHLSRRDALANIYTAVASKRDSSYMRDIALLGMIFLPGTFFAQPNGLAMGRNLLWLGRCLHSRDDLALPNVGQEPRTAMVAVT